MALKPSPRPFTGYMNFSPDLVSKDFIEPRAMNLQEQNARRNLASQNTKILQRASKAAPNVRRFSVQKSEKKIAEDSANKRILLKERKERAEQKYREYVIKKSNSQKPKNATTK